MVVDSDNLCKISGFGTARDVSDPGNRPLELRFRWAAVELLPPPSLVQTLAWRRSGDSGLDAVQHALGEALRAGVDGRGTGGDEGEDGDGNGDRNGGAIADTSVDALQFVLPSYTT